MSVIDAQNDEPVPASSGTSRSLISGLRRQDDEAWRRLVALYAPLVVHWLKRWSVPPREMADVLQDVFRCVARGVKTFRKDRPSDTFRGWLRQIALNNARDFFRRKKHHPQAMGGTDALLWIKEVPAETLTQEDDDPVWSNVLRHALESIRGEFQATTWEAFWITVVEEKSAIDAGRQLNMSPGAVRVAKCRILQRLREILGESLD